MKHAVILANGEFPFHDIPLKKLQEAPFLVCCDGALNQLDQLNIAPNIVIGDMDSASDALKIKHQSKIIQIQEQDSNDLSKAVHWLVEAQYDSVDILGSGGLREDHCIANCFLLFSYWKNIHALMYTNYGTFECTQGRHTFPSFPGQQVSIFSPYGEHLDSENLQYPLQDVSLKDLWNGSLNESCGNQFTLISEQPILVFQLYKK